MIHLYTGKGKGKTTAAVGLCTRALGHGFKVCFASFNKDTDKYKYNEHDSLRKLGAEVISFAKGHPGLDKSLDPNKIAEDANIGLQFLRDKISNEKIDLLVMDEILIAVRDNFIPESKLIEFIEDKPTDLELVLTGRGATDGLIEKADYVSCIECVKHPFQKGQLARKGIEF
ncbi:MAG: cob(I)yrinic acid a,c-diamide adenosyltransferase [Marinifilaceae bacterium]|jgi:cob(I)alamin adenosyltransferase|nr:cob(I)yrinic acid a,c-diamide adenosyltransferase [Marinifilaceae bacterium]